MVMLYLGYNSAVTPSFSGIRIEHAVAVMLICIRSAYFSVLLLFFACLPESVSDRCYNNVKISADREFLASESGSLYTILENSQKCAENYEEASALGM